LQPSNPRRTLSARPKTRNSVADSINAMLA
jgi:hypothetical protein